MATTTTNPDGRARKSLAEQIDRLDAILDGLSEALQGAVADAVKDAVGQAVQEAVRAVLSELLTNRDLQQQLQQAAQPAPAPPQEAQGTKSWLGRAWGSVTGRLGEACQAVREASVRAGKRVWAGVLLGVGIAAGTAYLARERIATVAGQVYGWCQGLAQDAGTALSALLLALTVCGL
jgi:hypothetical protein